jgi:hypothetical protein
MAFMRLAALLVALVSAGALAAGSELPAPRADSANGTASARKSVGAGAALAERAAAFPGRARCVRVPGCPPIPPGASRSPFDRAVFSQCAAAGGCASAKDRGLCR